jgi:hypothetical protein
MITSTEALQLPHAQLSNNDIVECRLVLEKLDQHIRKYMSFDGPTPLEIPFRAMSRTAAKLLCFAAKKLKWTVNATLIAEQPRFQGGQPEPHHWVLQLQPMIEVYDELLAGVSLEPISDA